ncbi:AMP-binding protein, partial [Neorhizobium sp. DT-125]|uniref:AMP-binding protein n=1 Tax=Neorhizobium sp. DT-125 TaxID=3396163 RepID=UPI003F1D9E81
FVFENYPVDAELRKSQTTVTVDHVAANERTHYPVTLAVLPHEAISLRWSRDSQRIGGDMLDRIAAHYLELLGQLASGNEGFSGIRLGDLALSSPPAGAAPTSYPFEPVTARIARQAVLRTDSEAVSCEGAHLTYGELDAWANRIARRLKGLGVRPDERVGVATDRSSGLIAALVGIMRSGAAYVPLDPSYPADRLAHMIEDSGITRVVTDAATKQALADLLSGLDTVLVNEVGDESADPVATSVHPDQLAYVIYTSGSTGTPKGVGITHSNVARLLDATAPWYGFGPSDVWTMFHSYAFDVSVWEVFHCLATGGRLVVVPHWTARDPVAFHALLRSESVTVLSQTPSAFYPLMDYDRRAALPVDTLRFIIFAGEKLEPAALRGWLAARGEAAPQLINMYGIT